MFFKRGCAQHTALSKIVKQTGVGIMRTYICMKVGCCYCCVGVCVCFFIMLSNQYALVIVPKYLCMHLLYDPSLLPLYYTFETYNSKRKREKKEKRLLLLNAFACKLFSKCCYLCN